ncbi:hypothetical protein [uncultured Gimesia sp.]|uniref:hypothetical protein n=1 Tax=uncultured Gimesia sp. TaxID=1678688 RepID=UPI0030DC5C97
MNFSDNSKRSPILLALLFLGGLIGVWQIGKTLMGQKQPRPMTGQEMRQVMEEHEAKDRASWEKMWREVGKTPPGKVKER